MKNRREQFLQSVRTAIEYWSKVAETSKYITILDEDYPRDLLRSFRPPFVLER